MNVICLTVQAPGNSTYIIHTHIHSSIQTVFKKPLFLVQQCWKHANLWKPWDRYFRGHSTFSYHVFETAEVTNEYIACANMFYRRISTNANIFIHSLYVMHVSITNRVAALEMGTSCDGRLKLPQLPFQYWTTQIYPFVSNRFHNLIRNTILF